jgi:hypothetical protein
LFAVQKVLMFGPNSGFALAARGASAAEVSRRAVAPQVTIRLIAFSFVGPVE